MGMKTRVAPSSARYLNAKGKLWQIGASGLCLTESGNKSSFESYDDLYEAAAKIVRSKRKAGYAMAGSPQAHQAGVLNEVSTEQIAQLKSQFGPRRSIFGGDTWKELSEVLEDPEGHTGGVLLIDGDIVVDGNWDARQYAAVVVLGNCHVKGLLYQWETEPWFIVTKDLCVEDLVLAGNMDIGGDLLVKGCAEFESGLGYTHVGGRLRAETTMLWDMPVTCTVFETTTFISGKIGDNHPFPHLTFESSKVGRSIGPRLFGTEMIQFADTVLDYHGHEGDDRAQAIAANESPELSLGQNATRILLGLPLFRET